MKNILKNLIIVKTISSAFKEKNNILSFYNTKNPFGFKNIEYINGNKRSFNNINLLSGVSGVLLTIFDNIDSIESGVWEKIFLMDA